MAANAHTLLQSFQTNLPHYEYSNKSHTAPPGATSTQSTNPPKFAVLRNQNDRARRGQAYLNRLANENRQYLAQLQTALTAAMPRLTAAQIQQELQEAQEIANSLTTEYIPRREGAIWHENEADVVRTSALYLLHPVCQALWANLNNAQKFNSQSERTKDNVRTDVTFHRFVARPQPHRPFAVVEFKRRTVIRPQEFNNAVRVLPVGFTPTGPNAAQQIAAITSTIIPRALPPPAPIGTTVQCLFENGSYNLIKQASSQAIHHRTRHVILFDYDYMICCHFSQLDHSATVQALMQPGAGVKDFVEIDIYPTNMNGAQPNQNQDTVRLAMLGFLEHALNDTPP